MSFEGNHLYAFEDFRLDPEESLLERRGKPVPITPKALQLLQILVEHRGTVVKKETLMSEIWSDSFVEEGNLAYTARLLRKALDDDAKRPVFIETVPRKGYRFIAGVADVATASEREYDEPKVEVASETSGEIDHKTPSVSSEKLRTSWLGSATAVVVVLGISALFAVNQMIITRLSMAPILKNPFNAEQIFSTGNAVQTAISPNGKFIVYTDQSSGKWSLWLRQIATAENIQIVPPADVFYGGVAFSRDGNSVYFARGDSGAGQLDIYRVNTFGGIPTKVIQRTQGWIGVAPNSKQISFVRCEYRPNNNCSLYIAGIDGTNERLLLTRSEPMRIADNQFSPDGKFIAFAAGQSRTGSNDFGLFRVDVESGEESEITPHKFFNIKHLRWLPDGSGLLITARENFVPKFSIWNVSATTGTATMLTRDDGNFSGLSLDDEGRALVATKVDDDFGLYLESASDGVSRKLLAPGLNPNLLADGRVVYQSEDRDIWMIDSNGTNKRQLTRDPAADIRPIVSRDARYIFFTSNRSGSNHIWRMNIDGTDQRQITRDIGGYARYITPDGGWLYYRTAITNSFRKVPVDGGGEVAVPDIDKFAETFSPDGRSIASFVTEPGRGLKIAVRNLADLQLIETLDITDSDEVKPVDLQWSADGNSLNYMTKSEGKFAFWRRPLDSKTSIRIATPTSENVEQIDFGPDGKSFVTVRGNWIHDAFLITGLKY